MKKIHVSGLIFLIAIKSFTQAPTAGLLIYYPLDGSFVNSASIAVTNTGATASNNSLGNPNRAMFFNNPTPGGTATVYATQPIFAGINFSASQSFTFSHFFRINAMSTTSGNSSGGFYDNNLNLNGYGSWVWKPSGNVSGPIQLNFNWRNGSYNTNTATTTINVGTWYHLLVTITNGNFTAMYINGNLITHITGATGTGTPGYPLPAKFGTLDSPPNFPNYAGFNGDIDELRIYNRVLTAAEIILVANDVGCVTPTTPTVTAGGATTFCAGGSVTLTSSAATGNQWYKDAVLISGATNTTYNATTSGSYTVISTVSGCASAASNGIVVTVNTTPATPTATAGSATTFCSGGNVTLTSNAATGNQWYKDAVLISGATNTTYNATTSGSYTVISTVSGCPSSVSNAIVVTVNPIPSTPTATAGGATTFCAGGSVTLTSNAATGNQWYKDAVAIGGASNTTYNATTTGNYTVISTVGGCASVPSNAIAVTVNPAPSTPTATAGGATTFCTGGSVTLTSNAATGNQWYKDGVIISGATNTTYTATASGSYTVISTVGGCSSAVSNAVAVTVNPIPSTPTITAGGATTFCTGGSVTLTSNAATGSQWYKDGTLISGATNTTYNATTSGSYTVISTVSGCASAASNAITVTVNATPATPTINPSGTINACTGQTVTLTSSAAAGNQWYKDAVLISGATGTTFGATTAGVYTVVVTVSGCTSATSAGTTVNFTSTPSAPTITAGGPLIFCSGGSVTLTSSAASGNQWFKDGVAISGATNQTYSATASGSYTVQFSIGTCTSPQSAATVVTVNALPATPTVTAGGAITFCAGGNVILTSNAATGNQWYKDGVIISGATSTSYTATVSGSYTVISTVSGCASAASAATVVTVNAIPATPTITAGGATTFCAGGSVTLTSSAASGNQWRKDGVAISGATSNTYSATSGGSYTVISTINGCSSNISNAITVTVNALPTTPSITAGGATTFCTGGSVTLTSNAASGNQWYKDGVAISGATNTTYIANASGSYTVISTLNSCASAASAATVVTVNTIPATPVISPSGPAAICAGGNTTLTSSATSGNQWYNNAVAINGATNSTYAATAAGIYTVISTINGCSSASSNGKAITVNPLPAKPVITKTGLQLSTASNAAGYKWYYNNAIISGATTNTISPTGNGNYKVEITDANGCVNTSDDFNFLLNTANTITLGSTQYLITPNPANTTVNVFVNGSNPGSATLRLFNSTGHEVLVIPNINSSVTIPVSKFSGGLYVLQIANSSEKGSVKIIIQH